MWRSTILILMIALVLLSACVVPTPDTRMQATQIAADIFATQTAQAPPPSDTPAPTDTPTPQPTDTPTPEPTDTPEPVAAVARLLAEDFPPGFEELDPAELGMAPEAIGDGQFRVEDVFAFVEPDEFEIVIGFTIPVTSAIDRAGVDLMLRNPDTLTMFFMSGMGDVEIFDRAELAGVETIGDKGAGNRLLMDLDGIPVWMDLLVFRRGALAAILVSLYLEGSDPLAPVGELAAVLDARILATSEDGQ